MSTQGLLWPRCLWSWCRRVATEGRLCGLHAWYARVFLANDYWRTHEPPEPLAAWREVHR